VLDGDDSVRLIEQLERMSRGINVSPMPSNPNETGPKNPPMVDFFPQSDEISESKSQREDSNADATVAPILTEIAPPEEPRENSTLHWLLGGALLLQGVAITCRRWLMRRLGLL
jgi:hypothetical protein